jgi:hypothetical protein
VKSLGEEDMGGDSGLHGEFKIQQWRLWRFVSVMDDGKRLGCGGETER